MRKDNDNWDAPATDHRVVSADQLSVTQVHPDRQTLISGINANGLTHLELVGWPGIASADSYALVLRRDRILEVNGQHRADGWDDASQCAISDVTDGLAAFEITGQLALPILKRGGFIDPSMPSPSVARQCFGQSVFLYQAKPDIFRLHVTRCYAQAMRQLFRSHFGTLSEQAAPSRPNDDRPDP